MSPEDQEKELKAAEAEANAEDRQARTEKVVNGDDANAKKSLTRNMATYVELATSWADRHSLWYDLFGRRMMLTDQTGKVRQVENFDILSCQHLIALQTGIDVPKERLVDALTLLAMRKAVNPVLDYLTSTTWDGQSRILRVAPEILGTPEDDELSPILVAKWLISAVRRAQNPGCKVDTALVLVGTQGRRKSTFFATLGGKWFGDSDIPWRQPNNLAWHLGQAWVWELAEMSSMTKMTVERLKGSVTSCQDIGRAPYAAVPDVVPRNCVFGGTTNNTQYLVDTTGNRRWWTIEIPPAWQIDIAKLTAWRDQLWAEAVWLASLPGLPHWLDDEHERRLAERNDDHRAISSVEELTTAWAATTTSQCETFASILRILGIDHPTRQIEDQVRAGLAAAGWTRKQRRINGAKTWVWVAPAVVKDVPPLRLVPDPPESPESEGSESEGSDGDQFDRNFKINL